MIGIIENLLKKRFPETSNLISSSEYFKLLVELKKSNKSE